MANEQNLIPIEQVNSRRTREQHSNDSQKAGKKSGEVRRKRKAMKEQMEMLLSLPFKAENGNEFMRNLGIDDENIDNQMALMVVIYQKAMSGDMEFIEKIENIVKDKKVTSDTEDRIQIINDLPDDLEEDDDDETS